MTNKYLARLNLSSMLSTDEAAKAGIGHNMGDELDTLAVDVSTFEQALAIAEEARNGIASKSSEVRTVKVSGLVATARAIHRAGIKTDKDDAQFKRIITAYCGAVTAGSISKETSILRRAVSLESKKLLVPAVRAAENYVAAGKAMEKPVKAFENVFESLSSLANKDGAIPTYDVMAATDKDGNSKLFRPDDAAIKAKREREKAEREAAAKAASNVAPDDIASRFIAQFIDVAANMADADFDKEVTEIAEALRAKRAAIKAAKEAETKAAEAAKAEDVGTKGRKGKRAAAK